MTTTPGDDGVPPPAARGSSALDGLADALKALTEPDTVGGDRQDPEAGIGPGAIYQPTGPVHQVFGEQRTISAGTYTEQMVDQRTIVGSISIERPDRRRLISVAPPLPSVYVTREVPEQQLRAALTGADDARAVTIISGSPGAGKRSLAIALAHRLRDEGHFPGGVLWCDAGGRNFDEVLRDLLTSLGESLALSSTRLSTTHLWSTLNEWAREGAKDGGTPTRLLVVVVDLEADQLLRLLPAGPTPCRLLAISREMPPEHVSLTQVHQVRLDGLTPEECTAFFRRSLGDSAYQASKTTLDEIARAFDYLPLLISGAVAQFAERLTTPQSYLRRLREGAGDGETLADPAWQAFDLAIGALRPEEADLLALSGLFGDGDWPAEMAAACTLLPVAEVRRRLDLLVRRELLTRIGQRYQARSNIQRLARRRLEDWPEVRRVTAWNLLARYCLDLAQDRAADLQIGSELPPEPEAAAQLVTDFRDALARELPHIRRVLDWAAETESWHLVRRFAFLPFANLLTVPVANPTSLRIALSLGTITRLFVGLKHGARVTDDPSSYRGLVSWTYTSEMTADSQWTDRRGAPPGELWLDLAAVEVVAAYVCDTDVVEARLIGVRARESGWRRVSMAGASLWACDLAASVWVDCDLSQACLTESNLSGAVLRRVKLRKADLRQVNLTGASLCEVDLRGANLSGANLSGARLRAVQLQGATLDGVIWQGISGQFEVDDAEAEQIRAVESLGVARAGYQIDIHPIQLHNTITISGVRARADLRAVKGLHLRFGDADLAGSDLAGVRLEQCHVEDCNLDGAALRGAWLRRAHLSGVSLQDADLSMATLEQAHLDEVQLTGAHMRYVDAPGAVMIDTSLAGADLRAANLVDIKASGCNLRRADLSAADLLRAVLVEANLSQARLVAAYLYQAQLSGANLRGANLQHAWLSGADLEEANLRGADLAEAELSGANLTGAQVDPAALARCASLIGAFLPEGTQVTRLADRQAVTSAPSLRFAVISGELDGVDLAGRDLFGARIDADLSEANLQGACLSYAKIQGSLVNANLQGADLRHAQIRAALGGAVLRGADLSEALLHHATFSGDIGGARLTGCHMEGSVWPTQYGDLALERVFLTGAVLSGDFGDLSLSGADLTGAVLSGDFGDLSLYDANLCGATLSGQFGDLSLKKVITDAKTVFSGQFGDLSATESELATALMSGQFGDMLVEATGRVPVIYRGNLALLAVALYAVLARIPAEHAQPLGEIKEIVGLILWQHAATPGELIEHMKTLAPANVDFSGDAWQELTDSLAPAFSTHLGPQDTAARRPLTRRERRDLAERLRAAAAPLVAAAPDLAPLAEQVALLLAGASARQR